MRLLLKMLAGVSIIALGFTWCLPSHADLIWDWEIDNPIQVVSPTDTVLVLATLHNDVASTVVLNDFERGPLEVISVISVVTRGDFLPGLFTFDSGPLGEETLREQFFGVEIGPGESFSFVLYTRAPAAGAIPAGTYRNSGNDLGLMGFGPGSGFKPGGPVEVIVVPEPASVVLLPLPILGLIIFRRSRT
jgi:hypothetical protein